MTSALHRCPDCGACYADADDSCRVRFDTLLALDHSREEPWGSRHALAFAAFVLQHPARFSEASVVRARVLLERVFLHHEPLSHVIRAFRATPRSALGEAPLATDTGFAVTIADLGSFEAENYPDALERWCRAVLRVPPEGVA